MFRRPQADVVDLHPGTVFRAARDGDLELAGQVGVLAVAREERRDGLSDGQRVDDLLLVDARHGARADVPGRVAAGLHGGQPDVPETPPNARDVGDADPMELNVLPRREVGVAVPEDRAVVRALRKRVRGDTDLANLGRSHHTARDLDPHHEGVAPLALRVDADPLQSFLLARYLVDGGGTIPGVGVDDRLGNLEGVPRQFQLLDRVELPDVAIGPDELESAVASTAELHPVRVIKVAGH